MNSTAGAVELRNELSRALGLELPGTLVFDYPTADAIVRFLADKLLPGAGAGATAHGIAAAGTGEAAGAALPATRCVPARGF